MLISHIGTLWDGEEQLLKRETVLVHSATDTGSSNQQGAMLYWEAGRAAGHILRTRRNRSPRPARIDTDVRTITTHDTSHVTALTLTRPAIRKLYVSCLPQIR